MRDEDDEDNLDDGDDGDRDEDVQEDDGKYDVEEDSDEDPCRSYDEECDGVGHDGLALISGVFGCIPS